MAVTCSTATADRSADVEAKQNDILKNEDFIEGIRKYHVICNKFCKDFRELNKKQNAWKETARKIGLDATQRRGSKKMNHERCKKKRIISRLDQPEVQFLERLI